MTLRDKELKARVDAKRDQLRARLSELKASALGSAADEQERIEAKLHELETTLTDGWNNVTEAAVDKLNAWLRSVDERE